jgi:translation initiation factor 4E
MPPRPGRKEKEGEEGKKDVVQDKDRITNHLTGGGGGDRSKRHAGRATPEPEKKRELEPGSTPLDSTWVFWVLNHQRATKTSRWPGGNWAENQTRIHDIMTAEDFWAVHDAIHPPSVLGNADYSVFREGIFPAWEDQHVANGGRWLANFKGGLGSILDQLWLETLLVVLGEQEGSEVICGAVVSARPKGCKLAVWTSSCEPELVRSVGENLRVALGEGLKSAEMGSLHFDDFKRQQYTMTLTAGGASAE